LHDFAILHPCFASLHALSSCPPTWMGLCIFQYRPNNKKRWLFSAAISLGKGDFSFAVCHHQSGVPFSFTAAESWPLLFVIL